VHCWSTGPFFSGQMATISLPSTPLMILEPRGAPWDALGLSKSKKSAPWGPQSRLRP
jgi:hypothetical protein